MCVEAPLERVIGAVLVDDHKVVHANSSAAMPCSCFHAVNAVDGRTCLYASFTLSEAAVARKECGAVESVPCGGREGDIGGWSSWCKIWPCAASNKRWPEGGAKMSPYIHCRPYNKRPVGVPFSICVLGFRLRFKCILFTLTGFKPLYIFKHSTVCSIITKQIPSLPSLHLHLYLLCSRDYGNTRKYQR